MSFLISKVIKKTAGAGGGEGGDKQKIEGKTEGQAHIEQTNKQGLGYRKDQVQLMRKKGGIVKTYAALGPDQFHRAFCGTCGTYLQVNYRAWFRRDMFLCSKRLSIYPSVLPNPRVCQNFFLGFFHLFIYLFSYVSNIRFHTHALEVWLTHDQPIRPSRMPTTCASSPVRCLRLLTKTSAARSWSFSHATEFWTCPARCLSTRMGLTRTALWEPFLPPSILGNTPRVSIRSLETSCSAFAY